MQGAVLVVDAGVDVSKVGLVDQPDAVVADPVQQPGVGEDHLGRLPGLDLDPPAQLCVADQPLHLPSRAGGRDGADEIGHRRRERARLTAGLAAGRERRIAVGRCAVMNPTGHILAERTWLGVTRPAGVIRLRVLLGPWRAGVIRLRVLFGLRRPVRPGEQLAKPDLDLTGAHPGDRGLELGQDLALSHGTAVPLDIRVRILAARHISTLPAAARHLHPARVKM